MKQGRDLNSLAAELTRQQQTKRDFVVSAQLLRMDKAQELSFTTTAGEEKFLVNKLVHEQIADRLAIPNKYYQRMRVEAPELLDRNVNHWFGNATEQRMVRVLDGRARAFLSAKYRPLDNYELAEAVLPTISASGFKIVSSEITDTKLYLKALNEKMEAKVVGDVVQAGVVISNSEVGAGALSVAPLVYTLRCTNGMIVPDSRFRKMHVGRGQTLDLEQGREFFRDDTRLADDRALWLKVRDVVANAFDQVQFDKVCEKLTAAAADKIVGDPIQAVEVTQKLMGFNDSERNGVLVHLLQGQDLSRYGLLNAVTRYSQDVDSYDRATELESIGGLVLELPNRDWQAIANAH